MKVDFGARLKAARGLRRLTQEKLAELVGVSQACVAQWEENRERFRSPVLPKLARVLGVSEEYLSGEDDCMGAVEEFIVTPRATAPVTKRVPLRVAQAHAERKRKRGTK